MTSTTSESTLWAAGSYAPYHSEPEVTATIPGTRAARRLRAPMEGDLLTSNRVKPNPWVSKAPIHDRVEAQPILGRDLRSDVMRWLMNTAVIAGLMAGGLSTGVVAQDVPTSETLTLPVDVGAKLFLGRCSGCHTVGGAHLTGPELTPASLWPRAEVRAAIKRMETKAGPLKEEEIDALTDMLRSGHARERIDTLQQAMSAADEVTLAAPSAREGEMLFHGSRGLSNGGPSCVACHAAGGIGGNLGPDLTEVSSRMTELALRSGIEKAGYPVMKPIYERRPVSAQEAAHLTAYLGSFGRVPGGGSEPPVALLGLMGACGFLGLLAMFGRRPAAGTRQRLIQTENKR